MSEVKNVFNYIFHNIYTAEDGIQALEVLDNTKIDIIITDINMPNMDGLNFIKEVRDKNKKISVIILTAHSDQEMLLKASNLQIDGYLVKPMSFDKIANSLSNALSRIESSSTYTFENGIFYNTTSRTIENGEIETELGKKESRLLDLLIVNSHKVTTKEEIISIVWDLDNVTDSALKNLLSNLRAKIGKESIENYPGHGWKIKLK